MPVIETIFLLLLVALAFFWQDNARARELALEAAADACAADGLQLLDETVAGEWPRLVRDDEGRLAWRRVYHFEFSDDGDNRRPGRVVLLGQSVLSIRLPPRLTLVQEYHAPDHTRFH